MSPHLTWRRFGSLMKHLPDDSAFKRAFTIRMLREQENDGEKGSSEVDISEWTLSEQLLAHIVDLLSLSNWQRGGGKSAKPKMITSGYKKTAKPAPGLDVRALLAKAAPSKTVVAPDGTVE